jgi:hypothetical protein
VSRRLLFELLICTVLGGVTFAIGLSVGQKTMASTCDIVLQNVQAKLLFNRLDDEHHISSLLHKGCVNAAAETLAYNTDIEMQTMRDFVKNPALNSARSYIGARDPALLRDATAYSARFPNPWTEPACN